MCFVPLPRWLVSDRRYPFPCAWKKSYCATLSRKKQQQQQQLYNGSSTKPMHNNSLEFISNEWWYRCKSHSSLSCALVCPHSHQFTQLQLHKCICAQCTKKCSEPTYLHCNTCERHAVLVLLLLLLQPLHFLHSRIYSMSSLVYLFTSISGMRTKMRAWNWIILCICWCGVFHWLLFTTYIRVMWECCWARSCVFFRFFQFWPWPWHFILLPHTYIHTYRTIISPFIIVVS